MISWIDRTIDRVTMYRLVFWYLAATIGAAFALGLFGVIAVDPAALAFTTVIVLASGWVANQVFARVFNAVPNAESVYITAMILVLIMQPVGAADVAGIGAVVFATVWAMASKFIFALRRRHIFNPAAIGVALPALVLDHPATWWVSGQVWLIPVVVIGGLLLVRKLRRFDLVLAFAAANLITTVLTGNLDDIWGSLQFTLLSSPFFFFAFVMLTEPLTAPQGKFWRVAFGVLVGVLSSPNTVLFGYYFTPEVALLVGNLLTLAVSPQGRLVLTLERVEKAAAGAYDYIFQADRQLAFAPGQYLEWTLPIGNGDNRGNRRYFTIASAPTEDEVRLGVRFASAASAFKREMAKMNPGDVMVASQLAGSFTLPRDPDKKLVFIAGGIGVTPFRSMLKYLIDENDRRQVTVLYGCGSADEIAYPEVLDEARRVLGIKTHYAVMRPEGASTDMTIGMIDEAMIRRTVPDFAERTFYISGPQVMVSAHKKLLRHMGVPFWRIKTDFFPGLA